MRAAGPGVRTRGIEGSALPSELVASPSNQAGAQDSHGIADSTSDRVRAEAVRLGEVDGIGFVATEGERVRWAALDVAVSARREGYFCRVPFFAGASRAGLVCR